MALATKKTNSALGTAEKGSSPEPLRPKRAGSLIILDIQNGKPCVLMGKRAAGHIFLPNVYVFPGGRVDRADHTPFVGRDLSNSILEKILHEKPKISALQARACGVAALRETYEEVGLLVGSKQSSNDHWTHLLKDGYTPDLDPLNYVARAITPPGNVRRFDARFFAIRRDHFGPQLPVASDELKDLAWVPLGETEAVPMHRITQHVFQDISERVRREGVELDVEGPVTEYKKSHGKFVRNVN